LWFGVPDFAGDDCGIEAHRTKEKVLRSGADLTETQYIRLDNSNALLSLTFGGVASSWLFAEKL
jgi:hypothetical protein